MPKNSLLKIISLLLLSCAPAAAWAQGAALQDCTQVAGGGFFDNVVLAYQGGASSWLTNAGTVAQHIFWSLAAIEFVWSAINWALKKNDVNELMASLFFKMMSLMFFYWLIFTAPTWIPLVLQGFQQMATDVTGGTGTALPTVASGMVSPSAVASVGVCVVKNIGAALNASDLSLADEIIVGLTLIALVIVIAIAFVLIVLQIIMTEIEAFIVLFGGLVMLGFTGSRWTAPWGDKYFGYAVSVGAKLMVIYLVVTLGNSLVATYVNQILTGIQSTGGVPAFSASANIILVVLVYAGLAWNLPALAGTFLNGSPSTSLGTMAGAGLAAGGAVLGAAAAVVAGGAAAAAGAGKLAAGARSLAGASASAGAGSTSSSAPAMQRLAALSQKSSGQAGGNPGEAAGHSGNPGSSPGSPGEGNSGQPGGNSPGEAGEAPAGAGSPGSSAEGSPGASGEPGSGNPGGGSPGAGGATPGPADSPAASPTSRAGPDGPEASGDGVNALNDPQAQGSSPADDPQTALDRQQSKDRVKASISQKASNFAKQRLADAVQHLKSSDGHTGGVSIRLNHHED